MTDSDALARRLDRLQAGVRPDYDDDVLDRLVVLGRAGVGIGVAILADGVLFVGAVGKPVPFAEAVRDAAIDAIAHIDFTAEDRQSLLDGFVQAETRLQELMEERRELVERYPPDTTIDDIPVQDSFEYFGAFREPSTIDLRQVKVHYQGHAPMEVAHVRLHRSRIAAWWPLKAQGVEVNYSARPPEDDST